MYKSDEYCMLEYLTMNNKFEFVHIYTKRYNNVLKTMKILSSIEDLRYFCIYDHYDRVDII